MKHILELKHLGPINECRMEVKKFTVLTGQQSNGKSTIAKAIYFFRTVKQDIMNIMMQGGPKVVTGRGNADWTRTLKQHMREKFLQLFGTSWIMPDDMSMKYIYTDSVFIRVYLVAGQNEGENYIEFEFSQALEDYLEDLNEQSFLNISPGQKQFKEKELSRKLDDPYETIFIPAGRNLITLLSEQLNYIFTSLEGSQLRNIDYVTKRYTELILKIKPSFGNGVDGLIKRTEDNFKELGKERRMNPAIRLLRDTTQKILRGTYRYVNGEERLYLDEKKYVKINFASSGQQEIVWVLNLLLYYLLENRKVFLILEEPESHLYPDSQQTVAEVLSLFLNENNSELITTHSPYILGTFNYLLLAGQVPLEKESLVKQKLRKRYWVSPNISAAYHVQNGKLEEGLDHEDDVVLINNGLIDDASNEINQVTDFILECLYDEEDIDAGH